MKTKPLGCRLRHKLAMVPWILNFSALGIAATIHAVPFTSGNILVTRLGTHQMVEFTTAGGLVQSFNIPGPAGATETLRDVIVGSSGSAYLYNGTFTPVVTTLNPGTGTTSDRTLAGFSTVNNISYGGIGVLGSHVYATDMETFGSVDNLLKGIIRFDLSNGSATRFATTNDYQDLTVGGDGMLYALPGSSNRIDVFDPISLTLSRSITLNSTLAAADLRGLAVDFSGSIYAAAWNGSIYALSSAGIIINSLATGFSNLTDIDIDSSGNLVAGSRFGNVILTTISLANQSSFIDSSGGTIHVAWTSPLVVATPDGGGTFALLALSLGALRFARSRFA